MISSSAWPTPTPKRPPSASASTTRWPTDSKPTQSRTTRYSVPLISLRYGTVPVVRSVGGLADTVQEYDPKSGQGNGFVFHEYSSMGLFNALKRALDLYQHPVSWRQLQRQGMAADYSWSASAKRYDALYQELAAKKRA